MSTEFYRAFEDLHRGSRALIQSRQEVYLPFVSALAAVYPRAPMLDLGCGRGEWLELLKARGIEAHGVDLDEGMLQACRDHGLDVRQGDAIEYLRAQADASHAAVSAFHVVEHMPIDLVQTLIREALRVLMPGGLLILETPNPENLAVGTSSFYMDPTHLRPLPPDLLSFLPQFHGFGRTHVLRLQEGPALSGPGPVGLLDVLAGVSPDYTVVAQKQPEAIPAGEPADTLEAAFSRRHGVSLNDLALRFDLQWSHQFRELGATSEAARSAARAAEVTAATATRRAAASEDRVAAAELRTTGAEQRVADAEQRVANAQELVGAAEQRASAAEQRAREVEQQVLAAVDRALAAELNARAMSMQLTEVMALQREIVGLHHQLMAMRDSRSWRMTWPLRWLGDQYKALREQGWRRRLRQLAAKFGLAHRPTTAATPAPTTASAPPAPAPAAEPVPAPSAPAPAPPAEPPSPGEMHVEAEPAPSPKPMPAHPPSPPAPAVSAETRSVHEELLRALAVREAAARNT